MAEQRSKELKDRDLELARAQFKSIFDIDDKIRKRLKSDHEYIDGVAENAQGEPVGKMWTPAERAARGDLPTFELNALSGPISQVENGLGESRPAARMDPIGGGADAEKAEIWQGVIRRIQTRPEAEFAAAYAAGHLVKLGRGTWLLRHRYPEYNGDPQDPANWEMEIERCWIENQHAVYLAPANEPDGSDRLYGFILQPYSKEQFDAEFGVGEFEINTHAFSALSQGEQGGCLGWVQTNSIVVASWYRLKWTEVEILSEPHPVTGEQFTRTVKHKYCCHSKITATKEYAFEEIPIPFVPIVCGQANLSNVDGERDVKGLVRAGRQPQDLVNVYASYIGETIAQSGRQELWLANGQQEGIHADFLDMTKRMPYRLYQPTTVEGKLVGPPNVTNFEAPIQAMSHALQQAESFVRKATLFIDADSDESGAERSKISGRAMIQRQRQGEQGNSHFMRAYVFMIQLETKMLQAWIPSVYTATRVLMITGKDEQDYAVVTHFDEAYAGKAEQEAQALRSAHVANL